MGDANYSLTKDVLLQRQNDTINEDIFQTDCSFKALNYIAKRPSVDIVFDDVGYCVSSQSGERKILHNVSGEFRSGELTCILGPSGAGKSTLLNILTGYMNYGVNGSIKINGQDRDMKLFKKLSCYIMQDNLLQPRLTTLEALSIAADLKLGTNLTKEDKELIVTEILETLGLWKHRHTICDHLSGGQSKRLTIALELVNNPPVIFLDEPTSGLDVVSVRQLIILLRKLSHQGRTVICTIHQPSASLFEFFDSVYIVCKGRCCYQGTFPLLVPFLAEAGYVCPISHNPADFVIETLTDETTAIKKLSDLCQNGKISRKTDHLKNTQERTYIRHLKEKKKYDSEFMKDQNEIMDISTSFFTQFTILIKRMYIQGKRNKISWMIQFTTYIFCALLMGGIFYGGGNDGATPMANSKFYLSVLVFFVYTQAMIPILLFPTEIRIIRREYFNRWYGLKAFYAALTFSTIPSAMLFGMMFITIAYFLSGQLFEWNRFILFGIAGLLTGFCSEGLGLVIGSSLSATNGAILGPALVSPLLVLCCYGMGFGMYIEPSMKALMSLSFLRYGFSGLTLPLYQNRTLMDCSQDMCPYADPSIVLRELGLMNDTYWMQILGLMLFTVIHRSIAFFTLRHRLTFEYSNICLVRIKKYLNTNLLLLYLFLNVTIVGTLIVKETNNFYCQMSITMLACDNAVQFRI